MRSSRILLIAAAFLVLSFSTAHAQIAHGYSNVFAIDTVTAVDQGDIPPQATAVTSIYPNPFNPQTTIEFALAEAGAVELAVFDLRGRLIRVLDRESRPAGHYRAMWNGRDDAGRAMPTGTYFCRLVTPQGTQTEKLTLAK